MMLAQSAPGVLFHQHSFSRFQEMAAGDGGWAHGALRAFGDEERLSIVPEIPMDIADKSSLIHIALAVHEDEAGGEAADAAESGAGSIPQIRSIAAAGGNTQGLLDHNREDLAEAVALYAGGPRPLASAAALEDLGVVTVEEGEVAKV